MGKEEEIEWCKIRWVWRVWPNDDLLSSQFLLDKHRPMWRGVVLYQQPILAAPKFRMLTTEHAERHVRPLLNLRRSHLTALQNRNVVSLSVYARNYLLLERKTNWRDIILLGSSHTRALGDRQQATDDMQFSIFIEPSLTLKQHTTSY